MLCPYVGPNKCCVPTLGARVRRKMLYIKYSVYIVLALLWTLFQNWFPDIVPFWVIFVVFFSLDFLFDLGIKPQVIKNHPRDVS